MNNGDENKKEHGENGRGPVGHPLCTKAEALKYLADLSNNPSLANWLAGVAREEEARRLRRTGPKKTKELESLVVGDGEGSIGSVEALAPENGVVQMGVAEGAQGRDHLQTDAVLEYEEAGFQQQKVAVGAQGSNHLQTDAVSELEDGGFQQQKVNDTARGDIRSASSFGKRTEPTGRGNVLEESASVIDLCPSSAEEVKVTVHATSQEPVMNAKEDEFIGIMEEGKQAENDADLETKASLKAETANRKDIIPVKLLGKQAEEDASLERKVSLEAQSADRKDIIPKKHLRAPRYYEPQESSQQKCNNSGEDDVASDSSVQKKKKKKQKLCCICGHLGHKRRRCHKVNKCLFCGQKGHLAKDCPEEDIVRDQTSNFCLRCAYSGHDMFSCPNDYPSDDLERIQCYVCKAFGHLCCVNYGNEGPRPISCYNCGESDHLGSECKILPEQSRAPKRHMGRKERKKLRKERSGSKSACNQAKEVSRPKAARVPEFPKVAKIPVPKNYVPWFRPPHGFGNGPQSHAPGFNLPHRFGSGPQNYLPRFNPPHQFGSGPQNYVPRFNPPHQFGSDPQNYVPRFNPPHQFGSAPQNYVPRFNPPHQFGSAPQNYVPRYGYVPENYVPRFYPPHRFGNGPPVEFWNDEIINGKQSRPQWRGFNYPQQQTPRSHVWVSAAAAAAAEGNKISFSNSSGQSSIQPHQ